MMGRKERSSAPLINVSLEELVPQDHFYRHLERTLDLSIVREFVQETYAGSGRPSIDPVVFFKLQLVMFFEGLRSERLPMRHAADRLSVMWYLGYDFGEPLPDHSSLTRIRTRYGVEVFRRFFDKIVKQCQQAGLVWGRELYFDVWMKPLWIGSVATSQLKRIRRPCASDRCGWNPYLPKPKTGMGCDAFAYAGSGVSTVRPYALPQGKI